MRPIEKSVLALLVLVLALAAPGPAAADDRDLLKESFGEPYVFILFDTSGSMNWSTRCTAEQFAAGECGEDPDRPPVLCEDRDCFVPLNGDDPASKFYQAKQSLYEVLQEVEGVHFGFATFNQDSLGVRSKHWLYRARDNGVSLSGGVSYPAAGAEEVFGRSWTCDAGENNNTARFIGCRASDPADLSDPWELTRVQRLPKGGVQNNDEPQFYIRHGGTTYQVTYDIRNGEVLGASEIHVEVELERCDNSNCSNLTSLGEVEVHFDLISDFVSWDNQPSRTQPGEGYFAQHQGSGNNVTFNAADTSASGTCRGWDPTDDSSADPFDGYNLRFPTTAHPTWSPAMDVGDVIPLSWEGDNKQRVLERLAPSILLGQAPDFGVAGYFADSGRAGERFLRLRNQAARPLLPTGATPLGGSIRNFREWWAGCPQGSCPNDIGWSDIAAVQDADWACRKKYLLVISDGDDNCQGPDPCSNTAALFAQEAVKTYVVAFGVENTVHNKLNCMAHNGGTGEPIYPQNRQQLIDALTLIFGEIQEEARAFASAAVPTVQAEVADKIYLSSFTPLNNEPVWDGHLDAFLKPLEGALTPDGRPNREKRCFTEDNNTLPNSGCHLWDAGTAMKVQAPDQAEIDAGTLKLGTGVEQRRVIYPQASSAGVPREMRLFTPPSGADRRDLWNGLGLRYTLDDEGANPSTNPVDQLTKGIIEKTLVLKTSTVEDPDGGSTDIEYILGDIFHSNPVVVDRPADFRAFAGNYYNDNVNDPGGLVCPDSNPGYRCFAQKHQRRRKMVAVGANDGMLHLFDGGVFIPQADDPDTPVEETGFFTNGTGKELMAVIPRLTLPIVRDLARGASQVFAVDGTPRVIDVFIDPEYDSSGPTPSQREWRTVLISGLREGGSRDAGGRVTLDNGLPFTSGYFAVDVTHPDAYEADGPDHTDEDGKGNDSVPHCVLNHNENDCGPVPFGSVLWEFTDSLNGSPAECTDSTRISCGISFDEDGNLFPDLGDTWSVPVIGRIRVLDGSGNLQDRFVAIFGGGFDPDSRANPRRGDWLYMVDVETGEAIYKRRLVTPPPLTVAGAAASNPAAVDVNRDGYIDWIYIGTTAGTLYKVDISVPVEVIETDVPLLGGSQVTMDRITDPAWNPFPIFNASADGQRRPIFFPPTVLSVGQIGQFALAFGTGDREQLWTFDGTAGRFYMIVDENFTRAQALAGTLPKTDADYNFFDSESTTNQGSDFVLNPPNGRDRGWFMTLDDDERVVAPAFSVSGVTIFPTFQPQITFTEQPGGGRDDSVVCARTGDSRVFVMFSHNGDPILPSETGGATPDTRYMTVGEALVTPPFADQSATKNPTGDLPPPSPEKEAWKKAIKETLSELFPKGTRFANYTIDVSFIRSDTGLVGPIPIPIGIVEKNWKGF